MSLNGTVWAPIGPSPIAENGTQDNGLVSAIAINPNNPNIMYMGTAGGGLWRSNDGGTTWTPLFDRQLSLGIGEPGGIAIDPNNTDIVYAGTSSRINRQPQAGLFKSTDGGASWILLGSGYPAGNTGNAIQFVNQSINVVIVDPANSSVAYLGCTSGVFVSNDGGQNWTAGAGASGDARSLVLDTTSPAGSRILYAGLSSIGVVQSTDGGRNWTQILSASTPVVASALCPTPPCSPARSIGKYIVALAPPASPPNPAGVQVLYVTMQGRPVNLPPKPTDAPDPVGVFVSTNQGGTWTQQAATGMPTNTQGGYSFNMAVDPASPGDGINDILYFGTVNQSKSTDSGVSFSAKNALHSDTHSWAFIPQPSPNPSIVFCGNDGGLDKSTDGGSTWTPRNSGGLQTGLFYNIDSKPDATASVTVGALQDNKVETTKGGTLLGWLATDGGDGWDVAYDATIAGQVYASSGFYSSPCTQVHLLTGDATAFAANITPWGTTTDAGCYLAPVTTDPTTGGIVYVSGSQNLWQSRNAGTSWRILSPFAGTGNVDVAAANGNNVVIAVGNQVFVSTNSLAATVGLPTGVTFTNITRNLPSRNVARALFDPNDPTVIYAVLGGFNGGGAGQSGHVFRTTIGATSWTDISPALDLPFNAIALDGTDTPTTIYAGTDLGVIRSVDNGATWYVLDDIHFPRAPVLDLNLRAGVLRAATYGRGVFQFVPPAGPAIAVNLQNDLDFGVVCKGPVFLTLEIFNVGTKDLVIDSVQRLMGSASFSVLGTPGTPLVIAAGEDVDFTVMYVPSGPGIVDLATIRIVSNDPAAPVVDLLAFGAQGVGKVATAIADAGDIGSVCLGSFVEQTLTINNGGTCPLLIFDIASSSGEFLAPSVASYPLTVGVGDSIDVTIRFQPASFGIKFADITITSSDLSSPHTVPVSGVALAPKLALVIADSGDFGKCCLGSFIDQPLILNNTGRCTLSIRDITSSSPEFLVPSVLSYPLAIEAGGSLEIPIRFHPHHLGHRSGVITITSNDPAGSHTVDIHGLVPSGKLAITGSTIFGGVKCGCRVEKSVFICNVGECSLHVSAVELRHKHRHFRLINNPFPATLRPGACLEVVIQYRATERYPKACELIVKCDDPDTPVKCLDVMAYTLWQHFCCDCCDACRSNCCDECRRGCCDQCRHCCHDRDRDRDRGHHEHREPDEHREHHEDDDDD
jgi:hypothetical protein